MKAIKSTLTGQTFVVHEDLTVMIAELKAANVKMGMGSLKELLAGKRAQVNNFTVIELEETTGDDTAAAQNGAVANDAAGENVGSTDNAGGDTTGQQDNAGGADQGAQGGDADDQSQGGTEAQGNGDPVPGNQGGTHEQHVNAGSQSHKNDPGNGGDDTAGQGTKPDPVPGNQGGTHEQHVNAGAQSHKGDSDNGDDKPEPANPQPAPAPAPAAPANNAPAAPAAPAAPRAARKAMKPAEPKGKIKPVRKGTKIATGLEMLAAGTTQAELESKDVSDDVVDFVNRRVTKRGYGIEVNGDQVKLKFPQGTTAIVYGAGAPGDDAESGTQDQGAAPAPTPAPAENLPGQPGNTAAAGNDGGHGGDAAPAAQA